MECDGCFDGRRKRKSPSPTQAGRFLALGETIVRTHLNLLQHSPLTVAVLSIRQSTVSSSLLLASSSLRPPLAGLGYWATTDIAPALRRDDNPLAHTFDRTPSPRPRSSGYLRHWWNPLDLLQVCLRCSSSSSNSSRRFPPSPSNPLPRSAGLG